MRKILLATASASALCTFAMQAQAQVVVTLGGYTEFFAGFFDDELGPNRNKREFQLETEIVVKADGKADNGLLYGAKVELQNSTPNPGTGVGTDEASIYVGGPWGRFELGDFDGAADTLKIYAPVVGVEQIDGDYVDFAGGQPNFGMHIPNSGDCDQDHVPDPALRGLPGRRQLYAGVRQRGAERRRDSRIPAPTRMLANSASTTRVSSRASA